MQKMLWKPCVLHSVSLVSDMADIEILYEDKHLICVKKPYGVLSQGNENTKSLCDDISDYLVSKGENAQVYVLHRLDKTTGGVIVYAKTKEMASKMSTLIAQNQFHKTYLCVVSGEMQSESAKLSDLLYHDKFKNKTYVVKRERKGVKAASLLYDVLKVGERYGDKVSLVKVKLLTGRTHQIRVQFASRKHPLVGDRKYGSTIKSENIALWSHKIEFEHPVTGEYLSLKSQPDTEIFNMFE